MLQTYPAVIDEQGNVRLLEPVRLPAARRALVTILEDEPAIRAPETALWSETAPDEDWSRSEQEVDELLALCDAAAAMWEGEFDATQEIRQMRQERDERI